MLAVLNPGVYVPAAPAIVSGFVQQAIADVTDGSDITATFANPTTGGNLLVAWFFCQRTATVNTVTPPAGWTTAVTAEQAAGTIGPKIVGAYCQNAASQQAILFDINDARDQILHVYEIAGMLTSGVLDKAIPNVGTGLTASSGSTADTTQANEFAFGALAARQAASTLTGITPTDWGTARQSIGTTHATANSQVRGQTYDKILSATGPQSIAGTIAVSRAWAAAVMTFKAA